MRIIVKTTPQVVAFVDGTCDIVAGYTIPTQTGVEYYVGAVKQTTGFSTVLVSSTVTVTAVAATGYTLLETAPSSWTFTFHIPDPASCVLGAESVRPLPVTFVDNDCTLTASYTIPTITGVKYFVNGSLTPTVAGTYDVTENSTISVLAVADDGYIIDDGATFTWSHSFAIPSYLECHPLVTATPVQVTFTDITCDADGTYTIPSVTGVEYYIGEIKVAAGTYYVSVGSTVTVTAMAAEGYQLADVTDNWSHTYVVPPAESCVLGAVSTTPNPVVFTPATCSVLGYYTIPTTAGIKYYVNGNVVVAGTHSVANGKSVTVTAVAELDYEIKVGAVSSWTYSFVAPINCDGGGDVLGTTTSLPLTSGRGIDTTLFTFAIITFGASVISFILKRLSFRRME